MTKTIHTNDSSVQAIARAGFPGYKGWTFQLEVHADRAFAFPGNYWDGGSRSYYAVVRLAEQGRFDHPADQVLALAAQHIPPDCAIVEHSIFCGKDMGLSVHIHSDNAATLLPAPVELTFAEQCVLYAAGAFKNTYGGRTGIRKVEACSQAHFWQGPPLEPAEYDAAFESLKARRMLRKNGSITNEGRNAYTGHNWPRRAEVTS